MSTAQDNNGTKEEQRRRRTPSNRATAQHPHDAASDDTWTMLEPDLPRPGTPGHHYDEHVLRGVDPDTRLTELPRPDQNGATVIQPPKPKLGERVIAWYRRNIAQGVLAGIEHIAVTVFGALLVALSYFLLEHETAVHGDMINNSTLYDVIGNSHLQLTAVGIVLATLVASIADLTIHYLHHRPQNTQQIILMWRTFNLAVFKGFSLLFLGLIVVGSLSGAPSIIG